MIYCLHVHGFDNPAVRTLLLAATTIGEKSYSSAFQSQFPYQQIVPPNPFPSPPNISYCRPPRRRIASCASSLQLQQSASVQQAPTSTGWINLDTLTLRQTAQNQFNKVNDNNFIEEESDTKVIYPSPSIVERILIRDRLVYVKRDDALHLPCSNISGNKARKFLSLNNIPAIEFPDVIVSYGGPQSNAMVALAATVSSKNTELTLGLGDDDWLTSSEGDTRNNMLSQLDLAEEEDEGDGQNNDGYEPSSTNNAQTSSDVHKKRFIYYTKPMPRYLKKNPNGNLLRAMALDMEVRTLSHDEYTNLFGGLHGGSVLAPADLEPPVPGRSLWVPQGGACRIAQPGSDVLAGEIVDFWSKNGKGMPLAVCIPGGTCTTALLLHRSINRILGQRRANRNEPLDIRVVVIPCVGDDEYAVRQMISLDKSVGGNGRREDMPWVLKPRMDIDYGSARRRSKGYFTFGEPARAILQTFDEMNEHGLSLDLLYGAPAFNLLLQHWTSRSAECPIAGRQVMYIHTGGLEGVASQLTRYKHKGLVEP
ncbi:hypothetical protein ACHAWU_001437 [Discostella pseudostelligera]|uniref:1-aminocyclopropane-1-carboxylate deaminase n=1 Tax=Discostella pseudostelligera TaxID=259834 RepID=A0ABD3M3X0_9STRA